MVILIIPFHPVLSNQKGMVNMKNPNGYGSVVKLSGNRRKPYAVRKTTGWNEKGHPIYLPIGYTTSREEGNILLAQYNNDPWDIDARKITLAELFELYKEKELHKEGKSKQGSLKSAYRHTKKIYNMKYKEIKKIHMQDCIDNCGLGYSTQWSIKNLFGQLDKFALELDVINKSYAQLTTAEPIPETTKERLSNDEIEAVWAAYGGHKNEWLDSMLIFIYSGFRISELLTMKVDDVDLEQRIFTGGTKTNAGKNRIVPIHSLIYDMVQNRVAEGHSYLFSCNGKRVSSQRYYEKWAEMIAIVKIEKTPHECRHTFRSLLDDAGANKKCIDMMMGHKSQDVGLRRYTHKSLESLREAIELIKR